MSQTITPPKGTSRAPMAIQVGLVPGFALQDGDQIAKLLHTNNSWGLGNTVEWDGEAHGSNNFDHAAQINASVVILRHVTTTNSGVKLPEIQPIGIIRIYNQTPNVAHVFPPLNDQCIDEVPPAGSVWLSGGARCEYLFLGDNRWISNLLGSASA